MTVPHSDLIDTEKAEARKQAFAARRVVHGRVDVGRATRHLVGHLQGIPDVSVVSGFLPIRTEIDPRPAMAALSAAGLTLCVPVIAGGGKPLRFREWTSDCTLEAGPFGAEVPSKGRWLEPDVLIVPLLAFDAAGYRLGYGGGFYDRTLELLKSRRETRAVGYAYAGQQVPTVPRDAFDVRLDAIVTEAGVILPC